jgi:hypothetical protein
MFKLDKEIENLKKATSGMERLKNMAEKESAEIKDKIKYIPRTACNIRFRSGSGLVWTQPIENGDRFEPLMKWFTEENTEFFRQEIVKGYTIITRSSIEYFTIEET